MKDQQSIPNAPKSIKVNAGVYETDSKYGVVQVMKNEGTGMWQNIHKESGEWMQSFWTKKEALKSLTK